MEFPYGMNMETYTKMAGPSAKQIPYGMDGIHMELVSIPPGIRLECGGTVKTLKKRCSRQKKLKKLVKEWQKEIHVFLMRWLSCHHNHGCTAWGNWVHPHCQWKCLVNLWVEMRSATEQSFVFFECSLIHMLDCSFPLLSKSPRASRYSETYHLYTHLRRHRIPFYCSTSR